MHSPTCQATSRRDVARVAAGEVAVRYGTVWGRWQTAVNNGWSNWTSFGRPKGVKLVATPTLEPNADGRLELRAIGDDNQLWGRWQTAVNGAWSNWTGFGRPSGVKLHGCAALAPDADGRLELMAVGDDGALWSSWQTTPNGAWSNWASHGRPPGVELLPFTRG